MKKKMKSEKQKIKKRKEKGNERSRSILEGIEGRKKMMEKKREEVKKRSENKRIRGKMNKKKRGEKKERREREKRKERREFHLMNPGVPITFPLPFNGAEWRNMRNLFKKIRFFVEGFILKEEEHSIDRDQFISEKIETIEKLIYNRNYGCVEFERANKEYIDCMSDTEYGVMEGDDYPNLLTMRGHNGNTMCVIVN